MPSFDELLEKEHVREHVLFKQREDRIAKQRKIRAFYENAAEEEDSDDLNDMFSSGESAKSEDKSLPDFIRSAVRVTEALMTQFSFPLYPKISYNNVKNVKYAAHDQNVVVGGSVLLNCQFKTLNGMNRVATISVPIDRGEVITPAVMELDGRLYTIGQSAIDEIVDRATSYKVENTRGMFDPPYDQDERIMAMENKYNMGYKPRESGNIFDTKKRGKHDVHTSYELVTAAMDEAADNGEDTFPRQWSHLAQKYILPVIGSASPGTWMNPLINDGYCINPYGVNRGRMTMASKKAQMDKEDPMEEDLNGEDVLDSMDIEPRMYPSTKTPMESGDKIKFNGNDGPIRGKIVEIDPQNDYLIIESNGMRYQVHCDDIEPLPATFQKMWK